MHTNVELLADLLLKRLEECPMDQATQEKIQRAVFPFRKAIPKGQSQLPPSTLKLFCEKTQLVASRNDKIKKEHKILSILAETFDQLKQKSLELIDETHKRLVLQLFPGRRVLNFFENLEDGLYNENKQLEDGFRDLVSDWSPLFFFVPSESKLESLSAQMEKFHKDFISNISLELSSIETNLFRMYMPFPLPKSISKTIDTNPDNCICDNGLACHPSKRLNACLTGDGLLTIRSTMTNETLKAIQVPEFLSINRRSRFQAISSNQGLVSWSPFGSRLACSFGAAHLGIFDENYNKIFEIGHAPTELVWLEENIVATVSNGSSLGVHTIGKGAMARMIESSCQTIGFYSNKELLMGLYSVLALKNIYEVERTALIDFGHTNLIQKIETSNDRALAALIIAGENEGITLVNLAKRTKLWSVKLKEERPLQLLWAPGDICIIARAARKMIWFLDPNDGSVVYAYDELGTNLKCMAACFLSQELFVGDLAGNRTCLQISI